MSKMILPAGTAAVILYLFLKKRISLKRMLLFLAGTVIAGGILYSEIVSGGHRKITGLDKNTTENADEVIPLQVETEDGEEHDIEITIPEKSLTAEEKLSQLKKTRDSLDAQILGKNKSFEKIEWNLNLPGSFSDTPIVCTWDSDHPELLDWDGTLGTDNPAGGTDVILTGILQWDKERLTYQKTLRVYPSREDQALETKLQEESEKLNAETSADPDASVYRLPSEVDGKKVTWYQAEQGRGGILCVLVLFAAVCSVVAEKKKAQEREEKRKEGLLRDYPNLVSRIQLLTAAGMSLRQCMKRLSGEYPEVKRCWYEMESGVTEQDAYTHFGERCNTAEYRKLALLLAQSQKKGGRQLAMLLDQEVQEAFENRKRRARAEGEKASIRMIIPTGLMLVVVLVIIMVPAMLSF